MAKGTRWARMLAGLAVLALSSRRRAAMTAGATMIRLPPRGPHGIDLDIGLIDGRADLVARCRAVQRDEPRGRDHRGRTWDRRRVRALLSRRDRHRRRFSRDRRGGRSPPVRRPGSSTSELEVALDGITVMVNSASAIECLSTADLYAIFGPESEGIDSTADANALSGRSGGDGTMPTQELEITAPGEESGTYDAFIELSRDPRPRGRARGRARRTPRHFAPTTSRRRTTT